MKLPFKHSLISTAVIITLISSFPVASASAQTATSSAPKKIGQSIDMIKQHAIQAIDRRIEFLTKALSRISSAKRLSAQDKATFTANVNNYITSLNSLKAKISSDTDLATLKTDSQSITTNYRVFAFFLPQLRLIIAADSLSTVADKLTALAAKIQTNSNLTPAQQAFLTDMQTKIADAKKLIDQANSEVVGLKADGFPANKTSLMDARMKLKLAQQDLKIALQDARMIQGKKQNGKSIQEFRKIKHEQKSTTEH